MKYFNIFILFGILTIGCTNKNAEEQQSETTIISSEIVEITLEQAKIAGIESGSFEEEQLHQRIACTGEITLMPNSRATVSLPIEAIVEKVFVQTGNWVNKGDNLLQVKHPDIIDLQTEYLTKKNELTYLEKEYDRQKILYKEKAISDKIFQRTESDFNIHKAELSGLKEKLKLIGVNPITISESSVSSSLNVLAPISGYVDELTSGLGELISPNNPMLKVINNKEVCVVMEVFSRYKNFIENGQKLVFNISGNESQFEAKVTSVGQSVDAHKKTFKVVAKPQNTESYFTQGTFVEGHIYIPGKVEKVLPKEAVIMEGTDSYVFLKESPTRFKKVAVEIVEKFNGHVSIKEKDTALTDNIVIKGANYLVN